ncbi:MAG: hypothetical protein IH983_11875 [Planctomycetes bacterium]|nr:hypothetical protein [Planctomycetota bacterium]
MRNIFDQYMQPENRLTHALVCTLNGDRSLVRPFLRWAGSRDVPPPSQLRITEQQVPGETVSGDEGEGSGLPDACVFADDGWLLLVEAKVQAGISLGQLRRHIATAKRHGFDKPYLLLLSVDDPPRQLPERTAHRAWRDVYAWFRKRADSSHWARTFTDYMETFESQMIAENYSIRGTLTMFDGLRFDADNPYTYREGKRLIRLLGDELQKRKDLRRIGVDPKGERRSAITGRAGAGVWDFLPLKVGQGSGNFTAFPHLTMALGQTRAGAAITVPNGVRGGFRTKLKVVGEEGFLALLRDIEKRIRPVLRRSKGSTAMIYALQRHYRSQRSAAKTDARLEADLRTIIPGKRRKAKYQPQWVSAIYHVMSQKRSNIQLGVEVHLSYDCPVVRSARAIGLFATSWIAMSPLIDFVLED